MTCLIFSQRICLLQTTRILRYGDFGAASVFRVGRNESWPRARAQRPFRPPRDLTRRDRLRLRELCSLTKRPRKESSRRRPTSKTATSTKGLLLAVNHLSLPGPHSPSSAEDCRPFDFGSPPFPALPTTDRRPYFDLASTADAQQPGPLEPALTRTGPMPDRRAPPMDAGRVAELYRLHDQG
jgi:hypothetical protein